MTRPVGYFMQERTVVAFFVIEAINLRHLDQIFGPGIKRLASAMLDDGSCGTNESICPVDTLVERTGWRRLWIEFGRESFNLFSVEYDVVLQESYFSLCFLSVLPPLNA